MEIPFVFTLRQTGLVHGLAFWFDVAYLGSRQEINKFDCLFLWNNVLL